ncbi:MAG: hypothetical protein MMC33_003305 [Icmadophila ericetorum]|nr:hypothetical protein [Icmadophila ericetorum]
MADTSPFRNRPRFSAYSASSGSSTPYPSTRGSPLTSIFLSPFTNPSFSPFRSPRSKLVPPYSGILQFRPDHAGKPGRTSYGRLWYRHSFKSRLVLFLVVLLSVLLWWSKAWTEDLNLVRIGVSQFKLGSQLFEINLTKDLQFFPAANPKIHYVGRWTSTPNRLRKDGTFPGTYQGGGRKVFMLTLSQGVYFDISIANTTTLFVSLANTANPESTLILQRKQKMMLTSSSSTSTSTPNPGRPSFHTSPSFDQPAPPISLLARVDQEEYVFLPNSSGLVSIRSDDFVLGHEHQVRIIAPMTDDLGKGVVQLEGLWLSKGGKLLNVEGSDIEPSFGDDMWPTMDGSGTERKTKSGGSTGGYQEWKASQRNSTDEEVEDWAIFKPRKKILEVITDNPGGLSGRNPLSGVMGWEYLLGDMFDADHVGIDADGICLTQNCIGGAGQPAGMSDAFFRSGPPDSPYFEHLWLFQSYIPDILILNLGSSDFHSFITHTSSYNKTLPNLTRTFESAYVSFIRSIRRLAYTTHPSSLSASEGIISMPALIPIFIMRPFRGQLEHSTRTIVNEIRADGDKSVFWLDTSGWLEIGDGQSPTEDFVFDDPSGMSGDGASGKWRLTEKGNQKVAIFLHGHVCRYLSEDERFCPFLPPEVYKGKVFDPEEADFARYVEEEKERRLKEIFWGGGEEVGVGGGSRVQKFEDSVR